PPRRPRRRPPRPAPCRSPHRRQPRRWHRRSPLRVPSAYRLSPETARRLPEMRISSVVLLLVSLNETSKPALGSATARRQRHMVKAPLPALAKIVSAKRGHDVSLQCNPGNARGGNSLLHRSWLTRGALPMALRGFWSGYLK